MVGIISDSIRPLFAGAAPTEWLFCSRIVAWGQFRKFTLLSRESRNPLRKGQASSNSGGKEGLTAFNFD